VFHQLYAKPCQEALGKLFTDWEFVGIQLISIENSLCQLFHNMQITCKPSATLHAKSLKDYCFLWTRIYSNRTCLYCLCRPPEHIMTCGHAICDPCVKIFGTNVLGLEYYFSLSSCILCARPSNLKAQILPPTASPRILSIDGGGICGVVPLEFLQLLQKEVGPDIPIQDLFDEAFGTSSGEALPFGTFPLCLTC
jgi:hypothetical protein